MSTQLMFAVTAFVLGVLIGFEVISKARRRCTRR